jgi:hypothetical protein
MEDKNYSTLCAALANMPEYAPPNDIWFNLEAALDAEILLDEVVAELPQYAPPAQIWEAITESLPVTAAQSQTTGLSVWVRPLWRYAAAAILLLVTAFWWMRPSVTTTEWVALPSPTTPSIHPTETHTKPVIIPQKQTNPLRKPKSNAPKLLEESNIVRTNTVIDNRLLEACNAPEDAAFALLDAYCKEQLSICEQPNIKALKSELDELTEAKTALQSAIGQYADDPELVAQLVQIERERSVLLQKIMQSI